MCFHCNDWWPLSALGRAVLGLDPDTPYWLHGAWGGDLPCACACALSGRPVDEPYRAMVDWLLARNPEYGDIVKRLVPPERRSGDLYDACFCEIPLAFTLVNRPLSLEQTSVRDKTRPPPERLHSYGQFLEDCPDELGALWATVSSGDVVPLKKGAMWLDRTAAQRADLYDPLYFHNIPQKGWTPAGDQQGADA